MLPIPATTRDWIIVGLAFIVIIGAIVLTGLGLELPAWLLIAVSSVVNLFFGLQAEIKGKT